MIFSCGLTRDERVRREKEATEAWIARCTQWHDTFIFWPKVVGAQDGKKVCAWLQTVECKYWLYKGMLMGIDYPYDGEEWRVKYRIKRPSDTPRHSQEEK